MRMMLLIILKLALVVAEEGLRAVDVVLRLHSLILAKDLCIEQLFARFILPVKQLKVFLVKRSGACVDCFLESEFLR